LLDLTLENLRSLVKMELNCKKLKTLYVEWCFTSTEQSQVLLSCPSLRKFVWFHNNIVENWIIENLTDLDVIALGDYLENDKLKLKNLIAGVSHCNFLVIFKTFVKVIPKPHQLLLLPF
ncbi:hypothetical protein M569_13624, partial [Genlisea aurea]